MKKVYPRTVEASGDRLMNEKKTNYRGNTEARKRATNKYHKETIETIAVHVPKSGRNKEYYKSQAVAWGMSLNQFAISALDEKIARGPLSGDADQDETRGEKSS